VSSCLPLFLNFDPKLSSPTIASFRTVDSVEDVLEKAEKFGVQVIKPLGRPSSLTLLGLPEDCAPIAESCFNILNKVAYIHDPDGNWIELVPINIVSDIVACLTDLSLTFRLIVSLSFMSSFSTSERGAG
jgi:hypothetical protein